MKLARLWFVLPLLLSTFAAPQIARAEDVIPPKLLIRHFPQGTFCALPISITFTAPASPIMITFVANQWVSDGVTLQWTNQAIDNVTVAPSSLVALHTDPPPVGSSWDECYIVDPPEPPVSYFYFNGFTMPVLELFDTNPAARGWTGSAGTSFNSARTGPRNVDSASNPDFSGGCFQLGNGQGVPDPNAGETATLTLSGLTEGQSYDLGAWWDVNFVSNLFDTNYLTIMITTGTTPIATKSWGAVKSTYRR